MTKTTTITHAGSILLMLILLLSTLTISAKKAKKEKPIPAPKIQTLYMYGVSASFNDSIIYITDIQRVDSAYLKGKYMLGGITDYVSQMNTYFAKATGDRRTNTVFFKTTRQKAEKAYVKLRKRYTNSSGMDIKPLSESEFRFTGVKPE